MFMVFRTNKPPLDLDEIRIDRVKARSLTQPDLYARLVKLGVPNIRHDAGRDGLLEEYGYWLAGGQAE